MPRKYDPWEHLGQRLLERFVFPVFDQVFDYLAPLPPAPPPRSQKKGKSIRLTSPGANSWTADQQQAWYAQQRAAQQAFEHHQQQARARQRTYYDTLQVSPQADRDVIRAAYRNLSLRFHPDRNPGNKAAEERFKQISEAYAVLEDPQKRAAYDRTIS